MSGPLVSVVIPTLPKRKKLLERAITSVKAQTYENIELIVETGGNTACEARNLGIERAKGYFIAFLDDDDTWEPTKIEKQVAYMQEHPKCPLVIHWSHDKRVGEGRINKPPLDIPFYELIKGFQLSSTSSYLVRSAVLQEIKAMYGAIYDEQFPSGQEYDLALRITRHFGAVHCIQETLMTQYKTAGQISENWGNKIRTQFLFMHKWGMYYSLLDYCKRIGVSGLFFLGFLVGDKVMYPINFAKKRFETHD